MESATAARHKRERRNPTHRPVLWGFGYLALIPIFAVVYGNLPSGSFNDSNMRKEPAIANDAAVVRDDLTAAITERVHRIGWHSEGTNYAIDRSSVGVNGIGYGPKGRLVIEVSGSFDSTSPGPTTFGTFVDFVTAEVWDGYLGIETEKGARVELPVTRSNKAGHPIKAPPLIHPPLTLLFPYTGFTKSKPSDDGGLLVVPKPTFEDLQRFEAAGTGDPSYASGSWWRMSYLSAVTVTTLGFGDITPVSETARILVGLEAILGVVMVGLFLNALAARTRLP